MEESKHLLKETSLSIIRRCVRQLEAKAREGSGRACLDLADVYSPWSVFPDWIKAALPASDEQSKEFETQAFVHLSREAAVGIADSMRMLALFYQTGMGDVAVDVPRWIYWNEKALAAGCTFAANDLYAIYADPSSAYHDETRAKELLASLREKNCLVVPEVP